MPTEREIINNSKINSNLALLLSNSAGVHSYESKSPSSDFCVHSERSVGNQEENKNQRKSKRCKNRRGYSMGTYPFLSAALRYLEDQKPYLAETTIKERNRKFRYLNREYVRLWKEGKISTTNPKKLTEKDIGAILLWMKEKGLDPSTQRKYIGFLARVLTHGGNPVINQMKDKKLPLPRDVPKEIKTLSEEEIHHIQVSAEKLHGWHGEILRFVTTMYPYTGLRPSELRLARIEDIDTST
ncbi:MAG: hypothetical protein AB1485_06580, partial [Candidatus Thermoplasmatota archaeon]